MKHTKLETRQDGSALLVTMTLALAIGLAAASVGMIMKGDVKRNKIAVNQIKAQEIADGAAYQALAMIADDFDRLHNPTSEMTSGNLGEGAYAVSISSLGSSVAMLESTGTVEDQTKTVKVYFREPSMGAAFDKGIFANGDFIAKGGGCINGNLEHGSHSNQNSDIGGHVEIGGDADSVGATAVSGGATVNGSVRSGVDRITFPRLDFDHYYSVAESNNEVVDMDGGTFNMNGTYSPTGGVLWVVGDVHISGHTTVNGSLFVTGDIHQAGQFSNNLTVSDAPAMASRYGAVKLAGQSGKVKKDDDSSQSSLQGMVYAGAGRIDISGYHHIHGAVIAWQDVFTRGSWGVVDYVRQDPQLEMDHTVEILAWEY